MRIPWRTSLLMACLLIALLGCRAQSDSSSPCSNEQSYAGAQHRIAQYVSSLQELHPDPCRMYLSALFILTEPRHV